MNKTSENLRPTRFRRRSVRPRGGIFVLELILLLPIILLVLTLLYQVSTMMTTYQALRLTVFNAATAFAQAPGAAATNVPTTIQHSISGYYFGGVTVTPATDKDSWTTSGSTAAIKYRLLYSTDSGTNWNYYVPGTTSLTSGNDYWLAAELKLENADDVFPRYWLLTKFTGVTAIKSESMVLSQITVVKITSP